MKFKTVDEFFKQAPPETLSHLNAIRKILREALPGAEEVISYNMPAFKQEKVLVYYAPGKNHLGFYPTPRPIEKFKSKLGAYKHSKGAVQFPYDHPLPVELVTEMAQFRLEEVLSTSP